MPKLLKIDNRMYRVSDLKKAEKFYTDILGLKKAWEDQNAGMVGFVFEQSDSEIVIHTNPEIPKNDFSYLVRNVVSFCEEMKRQGYKVVLEPVAVRPGKYAIVADPDGNEIPIIDLSALGGVPKYE